ncbi:MAG: hypothetical protein IT307_14385, partial [Chloroflexi bacterium]|nr:hypothetical protein [Chloroflexota bacterium]
MKQRLDLALTAGLVLLGLGVRLAFVASGPPTMVTTDSITYVQPAYALATGQGFDLTLRRTAGYPLFLAAAFALTRVDLQAVAW